jgi:hypothetical protein
MMTNNLEQQGSAAFTWKVAEGQALWIKIGLTFLLFYAGEAILFWQGLGLAGPLLKIPFAAPILYPLGYWGLFGYVIYMIQCKNTASLTKSAAEKRFLKWQGGLLAAGITIGVVLSAFLTMRGSGNTTLGHVVLFLAMFEAAAIIGAMELNAGWLSAAGLWLVTALAIYIYPATLDLIPRIKDEDVWIGLATAAGFFLIGLFPKCVDRGR